MFKKTLILILLLGLFISVVASAAEVNKQTHLYSVKGDQQLYLDLYSDGSMNEQPCVLFMFGGAFARGTRDREDYIPYFNYLVENGYRVVSIDYRLGLKGIEEVDGLTDELAAGMLVNAIRMAVDDLMDATTYTLEHALLWKIDPQRIITHGSSAGAVTVLQAEYEMCNGMHKDRLPDGFRYRGVMAFAGAILNLAGDLVWQSAPAPILLMQGDADRQVPYNELRFGDIGFFGSKYISDQFIENAWVHSFYSFRDYGHEIASLPIREYWDEINSFLVHTIERSEPVTVLQTLINHETEEILNKEFTISDFLNGNYGL